MSTSVSCAFRAQLDHLASQGEFALQLGIVALQLLDLPIALVSCRFATHLLRAQARLPVGAQLLPPHRQLRAIQALLAQERTSPSYLSYKRPSAEEPDWSRERCAWFSWSPSRKLLRALRDYAQARERGGVLGLAQRKWATARHRLWSAVTGAEIPLNTWRIAGGLMMPHPNGIVVHPEAEIGPNCLLFQQVTIGTGPRPGVPKLGGSVDVGPGAKILGGVTIGDHAVIGANAVVLCDVPAGAVAVGVPASLKKLIAVEDV